MSKYEVKDIIDPKQLRDDLAINEIDLSLSMMTQAGLFAYYSMMAANAQFQLDKFEQMEEIVNARLDKKVRDAASVEGVKITEAQVKHKAALESEAIAIRQAVNKARMIATICKSAADSFRHRRDMLTQMAFNGREERKGELRVNGPSYAEERQVADRENRRQRQENILSRTT
jgi:hypothetical protein